MTCYILGCPVAPVLSAVHRRYGPVCACRRHFPGPLSLPLAARAGWVAAPLAPAPAPFRGPGAELWAGPRALAPVALDAPPVAPVGPAGPPADPWGDRQPAPPPPPVRPPLGPAVVAPVAPRSPALPAERFVAPRLDASTLIAF